MPLSRTTVTRRRFIQALVLCLVLVALPGCVYLRLLRFKGQLNHFDEHVQVERSGGLALHLVKPLVRDSDFVFITESGPTAKGTLSSDPKVEAWDWEFEKESENDDDAFSIVFRTRFEEGLLTRIEFDPKLLQAIPEAHMVELFRSLGQARINKLRRSATATVTRDSVEDLPLPSLEDIRHAMGEPSEKLQKKKRRQWRYVFNFYNPEDRSHSGQFSLVFKSDAERLDSEMTSFDLIGKGR